MTTVAEFERWLGVAVPGERFTYYRGDMAHLHKEHDPNRGAFNPHQPVSELARSLARLGTVVLFQRVVRRERGASIYAYEAHRVSPQSLKRLARAGHAEIL